MVMASLIIAALQEIYILMEKTKLFRVMRDNCRIPSCCFVVLLLVEVSHDITTFSGCLFGQPRSELCYY